MFRRSEYEARPLFLRTAASTHQSIASGLANGLDSRAVRVTLDPSGTGSGELSSVSSEVSSSVIRTPTLLPSNETMPL